MPSYADGMMRRPSRFTVMQVGLALAALGTVALAPPARGAMLLAPLAADQPTAIRIATANGARLIGTGPAGTLFVWADARAVRPLLAAGVLTLAAPFAACGGAPA